MVEKGVVLIVDDVQSNVKILANILGDEYQIKIALSGEKAIELSLMSPMPDLILLDVEMPDMDGFDVIRELKNNSRTKDIPVIFITGNDETKAEEKGLINGAVDYITKPIRPVIVKARINTHLTLKYQRDALLYQASHDQLTGLYNRHHLAQEGNRKYAKALRQQEEFCAMIVDIDHFKNVNDTYGHLIGDEILKEVASILDKNKRIEDFTARYGGEEFVVLFNDCSLDNALFKADILRQRVKNALPCDIKITASFGVAQLNNSHTNFELLLKSADKALYEAKETGRDKVIAIDENNKFLSIEDIE